MQAGAGEIDNLSASIVMVLSAHFRLVQRNFKGERFSTRQNNEKEENVTTTIFRFKATQ